MKIMQNNILKVACIMAQTNKHMIKNLIRILEPPH